MKPYEADYRIVVISDAHCMNAEAANALLKVLEEPDGVVNVTVPWRALKSESLLGTRHQALGTYIEFVSAPTSKVPEEIVRFATVSELPSTKVSVVPS